MNMDKELLSLMVNGLQQMRGIFIPLYCNRTKHKEVLNNVKDIDNTIRKGRDEGKMPYNLCIAFGTAYRAYGDALREIEKAVKSLAEFERMYVDVIKSEQQENT